MSDFKVYKAALAERRRAERRECVRVKQAFPPGTRVEHWHGEELRTSTVVCLFTCRELLVRGAMGTAYTIRASSVERLLAKGEG